MASSPDSLVANLSLEKLKETEKVLEDKIHWSPGKVCIHTAT